LPANYNLTLFDPNGLNVSSKKTAGTADEILKYNTSVVGTYKVKVSGKNGAFDASNCYHLRVDISSSPWRFEFNEPFEVILAPNPARDDLSVTYSGHEGAQVRINVYNLMGQLMNSSMEIAAEGTNTHELDLSSFTGGIYLVEVINGDAVVKKKFEVVR